MKWKKIISVILVFSLVISLFPQIGFAAGEEDTIYYSPVELWSLLDIGYDNYQTPLGEVNANAPSSVIKVFNAKDDINNNANVYPQYQSFKDNATGELKNISYRSYLNLKGYDLRKWCTGWNYPSITYNYPLEKTLPEAISSQWYKNYAASYSFSLDGQWMYDYDYSSDTMKIIPNTYSNTTNMFHKRDFMMAVPYEAFSLYEKKSDNDIANTYLVGVTTVTSQTDNWIKYGYTETSIDRWKSVISNGMNYGEQLSFYGTGETRNNYVNRARFQNIGVYLRDIQGPKVTKVSFTKTDPLVKPVWDAETSNEYNTNDSYLYISLKLDEPVKFKDSYATASNQENLKKMGLVFNTIGVDGSSGQDKTAKFYRYTPAQNDPTPIIVFKYKLPANEYFRISEINIDDSKNHDFFSNLTDVAGNPYNMNVNQPTQPVSQRFVMSELPVVDTQKPTLLTPDMSSSKGGAYLNTDSILTVNVNFSEIMKTANASTGLNNSLLFNARGNVANIAAVTNLKDSSGKDVLILPSENMSGPWQYYEIFNGRYSVRKVGSINAPDSSTVSLGYKIPEGCYLPEDQTIVKVTGIKQLVVDGTGYIKRDENGNPVIVKDENGQDVIQIEDVNSNKMDLSNLNLSSAQQMKVDSYKPVLEVSDPLEADGTTKITAPKKTLYFKVMAKDKQADKYSSGFSGQTASFYFGTEAYYGYPKTGFDYAVSSSTTIDTNAWSHTDTDNATIHFPLLDSQEDYYIAIKLADKSVLERINYSCSISDNAGSNSSMSKTDYAYALDIAEPLLTFADEPKLIGRANGTKYFNVGVYARDDSDVTVEYVWKDAAVTGEPDWATDTDVNEVTLGEYDWQSGSNIDYTSQYGNAILELTEAKCWNKQLWIRAVDAHGMATPATNITDFVADTRKASIDVVPMTPTDRLVTGKPVAKIHIDPTMSAEDKETTLISYRWVVEKRPNALTWAQVYFHTEPGHTEPELHYLVPEQEETQWITTSASAISFDSNGDYELTMSDMRYNFTSNNDLWATWDNSTPVNGDVTLYVKSQINYTKAYKTVTFKVSDTVNSSMDLGNGVVGLYLKPTKFEYDENTKTETQDDEIRNNVVKLDENDRMQAEIKYEFTNCNEDWGTRRLSRELVDFESPDTKLELVRFKIKDDYKNNPNVNGAPEDLRENIYTSAIQSTTKLDFLTADMYTEEVVYSEKITEGQLKQISSDNYWTLLGVSVDLPAYLFKSALWKEGDPLEVYGIRASLARKPIYDITQGKDIQPALIVDEIKNIIIDNTQIEQGSISSVKNKNEDVKAVVSDMKAKAANIVTANDGSGITYIDETDTRDRIYVSEEYPEITFRTMGAFFEGRLADVKNWDSTFDRYYGRNVARVSVGNDISDGYIRYNESYPRFSMPVNKAVTTEGSTDTYKAYEYTVNGRGPINPEISEEWNSLPDDWDFNNPLPIIQHKQLKLEPGENTIYYQFVGSNGTQSPINTVTIVLDKSKPDIVFKALPAPTVENPDLVTNTEVKAGVDYAIDSIVLENGTSIIGTPSDKIVITSEAYYGDTVPGTFSYHEDALTAPKKNADGTFTFKKNGNIVATASDELGNSTTETYKIDWIDTQAPVVTALNQSGTDKINLSATVTDDRSADEISCTVTFDDDYTKYLLGVDTLTDENRWIPMASGSNMPGLISSSVSNGTAVLQAYIKTGDNSPVPTDAIVKATDRAGNSSTEEITLAGMIASKPAITASSYNSTDGFTIIFNQPVKLKNLTSDTNSTAAIHKKVSIYADGNYQVTYIDLFGQEHSETITADIFGIAYKHSVMLSSSRPTKNPVTITLDATMTEGIYLQLNDETIGTIKKTGETTVNNTEVCKKLEITLSQNETFTYNLISSVNNIASMTATFALTNIDKEAPVANYFRKVDGTEILEEDGSISITGTVAYQIISFNEENVVMAEGSPSTYTFDKAGEHTFLFTDEAGNQGKLIVTETGTFIPKAVANDTTPPDYTLSYSAGGKEMVMLNSTDNHGYISGSYKPAFDKVSGDVTVDIKSIDDNPVTMTVLNDGSGLAKYVAGQLGLTFTDNATAQVRLTDAKNNSTTVNIKVACIDKTAPTGVINYEVQTDRTVIAYLDSYSEDAVVLNSPGMQYNDTLNKYYYHFTGNGTCMFSLQDEAGNLGNLVAKVVSIDVSAPKISKDNTTWNPSAQNDISTAPYGIKTNSNVTVFFLMNERISAVDIGVVDPANVTDISPYISYSFAASSVTIEFKQNCQISMMLTDLAGNRTNAILVPDVKLDVIDKAAPELVASSQGAPNPVVEIINNKATYTYTFNEPVRIVSELGSGYTMSFIKTYDRNGSVSHTFADEAGNTMTATVNVDQLDLTAPTFNYKIKATMGDSAIGNSGLSTTNKPVTVIITSSEDCTLTIGRRGDRIKTSYSYTVGAQSVPIEYTVSTNGIYEIVAVDAAGNRSTGLVSISFIDTEAPRITMPTGSIYNLVQNAAASAADLSSILNKLMAGVTANDEIDGACQVSLTGLTLNDLKNEGEYTASFTAVDKAGNIGTATRKVKVYSSQTAFFKINDKDAASGAVTTLYERLITITPPETIKGEYKLSFKKGYQTMAQMKYGATAIKDNSFTAAESGYYTLLVQSTDRVSYVTYIYIAK